MKGAILDQSLGLQQKQQLTMSPLLQESINILQLAAVDIQDYVLEFNENNPFVTLDGGGDEEAVHSSVRVLRRVRHHLGVRHSTDLKRRRHRDVDRLRCEVKWPWRGTRPS